MACHLCGANPLSVPMQVYYQFYPWEQISVKYDMMNENATIFIKKVHFDGLVQNCSICIAKTLEILQFCAKPSIWKYLQNGGLFVFASMCSPNELPGVILSGVW